MSQSDIVKRIEEICREFDARVIDVGLQIARAEISKALAENEASKYSTISEKQISKIADEAIAEGRSYTDYAWHYIGEDNAHQIICDAINKALKG
jgi:hypothetical protein